MLTDILVVLGVHRSGTSLLALALAASGASLGKFSDITDVDNPEGYGEHPALRSFNDRFLEHLGASWDNWGFFAPGVDFDHQRLADWRQEAKALLEQMMAEAGRHRLVIKDPRMTQLLPFWERVFQGSGVPVRRILIVRDPAAVAQSQQGRVERRPGAFPVISDTEPMAALWAVMMQTALMSVSGDVTLVAHRALVTEPEKTLVALTRRLGMRPGPGKIAGFVSETFKADLHRARAESTPHASAPVDSESTESYPQLSAWRDLASRLFFDLPQSPTGVDQLTVAEARAVAARQRALNNFLPLLSAVRSSISRLRQPPAEVVRQQALELGGFHPKNVHAMGQMVWALGGSLPVGADQGELQALRDRIVASLKGAPPDLTLLIALARLDRRLGDDAKAQDWIKSAMLAFPDHPLPEKFYSAFTGSMPQKNS